MVSYKMFVEWVLITLYKEIFKKWLRKGDPLGKRKLIGDPFNKRDPGPLNGSLFGSLWKAYFKQIGWRPK